MKPLKRRGRTDETSVNLPDTKPEFKLLKVEIPPDSTKVKPRENDENGNDLDCLLREKPKKNPCKLCKEVFGSMDELIMHAKIEHTPRKHKTFSVKDIEYFLRVFSKLKKSHCPICHKAILNTLNWRGHMYKHCVVKNVSCRVCGKSFTRSDHCKDHEARHKLKVEEQSSDDDSDE